MYLLVSFLGPTLSFLLLLPEKYVSINFTISFYSSFFVSSLYCVYQLVYKLIENILITLDTCNVFQRVVQ
jgi:hypothetical protein